MKITIKVPATTANLGPGFDSLGLALDLWNETTVTLAMEFSVTVHGEGAQKIPQGKNNLILRAAHRLGECVGRSLLPFHAECVNHIPPGSGLGSSAAAVLTGLLAANALMGNPLLREEILSLASEMEGHPDNVAPALMGGLVVSTVDEGHADGAMRHKIIARQLPITSLEVTVAVPEFNLSTRQARAALPEQVSLRDAVHNISRALLVTESLRTGELDLLGKAMTDRLHQSHRLKLIPGAASAMEAAKESGASAVALSGAGPSVIAFSSKAEPAVGESMKRAFEEAGLQARIFHLGVSSRGAEVQIR